MKTQSAFRSFQVLAVAGLLAASAQFATAQIAVANNPSAPTADQSATVQVSAGTAEILKLSAAHVGDDAIVAYIGTSGNSFTLGVNDIIYLKNQGVSDRVITAMLNQSKHTVDVTVQTAPATTTTAPAVQAPASVYANAPGTQYQYAPVAQQTAYAQTAPATTYVVPSTTYASYPASYYYSSYPYAYGYGYPYYGGYCSSGLSVGIGIGFGGGYCGGWGYRGCGWGSSCWGRGGWCGGGWGGCRGGFCRR